MDTFKLPERAVVYVMDAYCGWCWGFSHRLGEFEAANRHRVPFTAVSGGLFVGPRAAAIADYPHIPEANTRIARLTGAVFGPAYQALLNKGAMVMDSLDAGAALAALRAQDPGRAVHWAHQLQDAFYGRGESLSEPATIVAIAKAEGLDAEEVLRQLTEGSAKVQAKADFKLARDRLGVSSYPTLLFVDDLKVHPLPATGTSLATLNAKLDALLSDQVSSSTRPEASQGDHVNDPTILAHIAELVEEERRLRSDASTDDSTVERLKRLAEQLDQCWDLLRQRRAKREYGEDPSTARLRDVNIVERYKN